MIVLAIDPGCEMSARVLYDTEHGVIGYKHSPNDETLELLQSGRWECDHAAIEMVASYGMAVGREVFETVFWIGRFYEAINRIYPFDCERVYRRDVKMHLCGNNTAKDANIRQSLIDKFGPGKDKAIGKKATPGPLYGISGDCWAALAVAVTFAETRCVVAVLPPASGAAKEMEDAV